MFQCDLVTLWEKQRESGDLDQSDHLSRLVNIQINFATDHATASTLLIEKEADRICKRNLKAINHVSRKRNRFDMISTREVSLLWTISVPLSLELMPKSSMSLSWSPQRGNESVLRRIELTVDAAFREICRPREGRSLKIWRLSGARNARWNGIGEFQSTLSVGDNGAVPVHRRTHNGQQSRLEHCVTAGICAELQRTGDFS